MARSGATGAKDEVVVLDAEPAVGVDKAEISSTVDIGRWAVREDGVGAEESALAEGNPQPPVSGIPRRMYTSRTRL